MSGRAKPGLPSTRREVVCAEETAVDALFVTLVGIAGAAAGVTPAWAWVSLVSITLLSACSMLIVWSEPLHPAPAAPVVRR